MLEWISRDPMTLEGFWKSFESHDQEKFVSPVLVVNCLVLLVD